MRGNIRKYENTSLAGSPFETSDDHITFFNLIGYGGAQKKEAFLMFLLTDAEGKCQAAGPEQFSKWLYNSMRYIGKLRGIAEGAINKLWEDSASSQFPLEETNRLLKNDLRYFCDTLKIKRGVISNAIKALMNAITRESTEEQKEILDQLWDASRNCGDILAKIRSFIEDHGYSSASAMLELIQNADDALLQHGAPQSLSVHINYGNGVLEFSHYGRPINLGKEESYKRDLYNMLRFNASEKYGTDATGRFGLGFKSVYLLTDETQIQSGSLCFRICNGLFPEAEQKRMPGVEDDYDITKFRLPLRSGMTGEEIFSRLDAAAALIPVFSQRIGCLRITRNGNEEHYNFQKPNGARDCGFVADAVNHILYFYAMDIRAAMALCLDSSGLPAPLPSADHPVWTTLPLLDEGNGWRLRYAVNGPFSLDAGRTHLSGNEKNLEILQSLGQSLGHSLTEWGVTVKKAHGDNSRKHYHALWRILSTGLDDLENPPDKKKAAFLTALHTNGRGLSHWLKEGKALGHGIPESWSRPQADISQPLLANELCGENEFVEFVNGLQHAGKAEALGACGVISSVSGRKLRSLRMPGMRCDDADDEQIFKRIFAAITDNYQVDVWLFAACLPILDMLPANHQMPLKVKTQAGAWQDIRQVLLPPALGDESGYSDFREELYLSRFFAGEHVLCDAYIQGHSRNKPSEYARLFRKLRVRRDISAETIAEMIAGAEGEKREAAVCYLGSDTIPDELWSIISDGCSDTWIGNESEVSAICDKANVQQRTIIPKLFDTEESFKEKRRRDQARVDHSYSNGYLPPDLQIIVAGWDKDKSLVQKEYIESTYPQAYHDQKLLKQKLDSEDREAWLLLLFMACLKSVGRTQEQAVRNFISDFIKFKFQCIQWQIGSG